MFAKFLLKQASNFLVENFVCRKLENSLALTVIASIDKM